MNDQIRHVPSTNVTRKLIRAKIQAARPHPALVPVRLAAISRGVLILPIAWVTLSIIAPMFKSVTLPAAFMIASLAWKMPPILDPNICSASGLVPVGIKTEKEYSTGLSSCASLEGETDRSG